MHKKFTLYPNIADQCNLIIRFVSNKISKLEYLKQTKKINDLNISQSIELSEEEFKIHPAFEHESCHIKVWEKYGFKCKVYKMGLAVFNSPIDTIEDFQKLSKEKIIKIMKEVCIAPYKNGFKTGVSADLLYYEAFCNNLSSVDLENQYNNLFIKYKLV